MVGFPGTHGWISRGCRAAVAILVLALSMTGACADDDAADEPPAIPHFESWSGVTASENATFAYGGIIAAPFGAVTEDGLRLRLQGGGGLYAYDGTMEIGAETFDIRYLGQSTVTEALVGFQQRLGPTIAKAYVGAVYNERVVRPLAPDAAPEEPQVGAKATIELWHDWSDRVWISLDLGYATTASAYDGNARAAYRLLSTLSLGLEAGTFGNEDYASVRLGLLVKWDTSYGELMLSGGLSGDMLDPSMPYGSLSVLSRF